MSTNTLHITADLAYPSFRFQVQQDLSATGYTGVFGPSGSGKSTLLRLIAGFERPDLGRIQFQDHVWCNTQQKQFVPAHKRSVGYMFQDGRLFPHLNVHENLEFANKRSTSTSAGYTTDDIIDAFDIGPLVQRKPSSLSGGERQRCALARTLLTRPELLLLDEPLSALDRDRKASILPYLEGLPVKFGLPVIYVSHNVDEIIHLAEKVLLLRDGRVQGYGPTASVLNSFTPDASGEFVMIGTVLSGVIEARDSISLLTHVRIGDATLSLPTNTHHQPGETASLRIDPRNVAIATAEPTGLSIQNTLPATVSVRDDKLGTPFTDITLDIAGTPLKARITQKAANDLKIEPGQAVFALIKSASFEL